MTDLQNAWSRRPQPPISERVGDYVRPKGPLKPRVKSAIKQLRLQIRRLDGMLGDLHRRDAKLFERVVVAIQEHKTQDSKVLGNELAEIRKLIKILGGARIALEQIEMRLNTCSDLGDAVVTIMPTIALMRNIKTSLGRVMPSAEQEIGQMADMLGGLMNESFAGDSALGIDTTTSAEADEILKEAAAVAGGATGQMFPSVPAGTRGIPSASGQPNS